MGKGEKIRTAVTDNNKKLKKINRTNPIKAI